MGRHASVSSISTHTTGSPVQVAGTPLADARRAGTGARSAWTAGLLAEQWCTGRVAAPLLAGPALGCARGVWFRVCTRRWCVRRLRGIALDA
jgi:hypothetical protein